MLPFSCQTNTEANATISLKMLFFYYGLRKIYRLFYLYLCFHVSCKLILLVKLVLTVAKEETSTNSVFVVVVVVILLLTHFGVTI